MRMSEEVIADEEILNDGEILTLPHDEMMSDVRKLLLYLLLSSNMETGRFTNEFFRVLDGSLSNAVEKDVVYVQDIEEKLKTMKKNRVYWRQKSGKLERGSIDFQEELNVLVTKYATVRITQILIDTRVLPTIEAQDVRKYNIKKARQEIRGQEEELAHKRQKLLTSQGEARWISVRKGTTKRN